MALQKKTRAGGGPVRSNLLDTYMVYLRAETNNISAPDGDDSSIKGTWGYTSTGIITFTVNAAQKFRRVIHATCTSEETDLNTRIVFVSYTRSTGVLIFHLQTQDGVSALYALGDTTDKTMSIALTVTDNPVHGT